MKVIAIESSTHSGSVSIADENGHLAARRVTQNTEELAASVNALLAETSTKKSEIGLIAVSGGPGFFTSLKVGAATAKAFAYALGVPIAPVPSLEILATCADCPPGGSVCAAIDARSGMFFWAVFEKRGSNLTRLTEDTVTTAEELVARTEEFKKKTGGKITAVVQEGDKQSAPLPEFSLQRADASVCAALGFRLMEEGKTETALSFTPTYLRGNLYGSGSAA